MSKYLRIVVLMLCVVPLGGWDTLVTKGEAWQSIYQRDASASIAEHTELSDMTFRHLDSSGRLVRLFGRGGSARATLVDLNASLFRARTVGAMSRVGDDRRTAIEERELPPPGHFAGIPDYSYGIYDWLNKNSTCPSFQDEAYTPRCHKFIGWLGGAEFCAFR